MDNNIPLKINLINRGHQFNFFIKADIYNQIFINFFFDFNKTKPFQYITINEYENRKNKTYTQSSNQTFEIKKSSNENESFISLSYKPINPSTKYIAVVLEPSAFFNYLVTKVNIGGGYYEFDKNKNISKLIAGTVYYFPIKISPLQKIEMNIKIFDDNIDTNKNPFTYANIYEKQNKEDNSFNTFYNITLANKKTSGMLMEYFTYPVDSFSTNYLLIELIPNMNLDLIEINYEIKDIDNYTLNNDESKTINKLLKNMPYYYFINVKQYQQINVNLTTNFLKDDAIKFIEIYEFSDKYSYNSYNKYINKSTEFINNDNNNNNVIQKSFSYMVESIYTNFIVIKIKTEFDLDYLNIRIDIGGGYHDIEKGFAKNITNLFCKYSYYFFVLTSKGEKLNFKLIINSNEIKDPFNSINILEYSNKQSYPIILLKTNNNKFHKEIIDNKLVTSISYQVKDNSTNFIALQIIPNYNISSVECLVEPEIEENKSLKGLIIILIVVIIFASIVFIIYIKKNCFKPSSGEIEDIYHKNNESDNNKKKLELSLLTKNPK